MTSLVILDQIFAGRRALISNPAPAITTLLSFQDRSSRNHLCTEEAREHLTQGSDVNLAAELMDDITSVNVELILIWKDVIGDVADTLGEEKDPFWTANSGRSRIISRLLTLESSKCFPAQRRFIHNLFRELVSQLYHYWSFEKLPSKQSQSSLRFNPPFLPPAPLHDSLLLVGP